MCKQKTYTDISTKNNVENVVENDKVENDAHITRLYRFFTSTTQPTHLILMLIIIYTSPILLPIQGANKFMQFAYVMATATHFGSQIWMTFISGLSLYMSLPRHDFGEVQKVLFPIYFTFTSLLSGISLFCHVHLSGYNTTTLLLGLCFTLEAFVRLHCCAPLIRLIGNKNKMEASHGFGREIGRLDKNSSLFSCPCYLLIHNQFRKLHMTIAITNMICISISTLHLWISLKNFQTC